MDLRNVEHHLEHSITGKILCNESMRKHTSWKIGGPADFIVMPASIADIRHCLRFVRENNVPLTVMGNGSNMLVKDKGIRGIVLKISQGFNNIVIKENTMSAEAGTLLPLAAKKAAQAGLTGLEFAAGIPASVGGAVTMNAGAHGRSMSEVVQEVTVLTPQGEITQLSKSEVGFQYRKTNIYEMDYIVLKTVFALEHGEPMEITAKNESNLAKRRRSQPLEYPNAGSVFANPPEQWAGWLLEQVDGKGMRIGDAMVSEKHANFIVNLGNATANDVLSLIDRLKQLVWEKFNIELKLEVRVVGE